MTLDVISQFGISFFGVIAIFLTQSEDEKKRKYACLFGLASQPFWFWSAGQWGILALSFLYSYCWLKGFNLHWSQKIKKLMAKRAV